MMNMIRVTTAVILIVGAGLVHGAWTNRWGPPPALAALAARFESVPMAIGDWKASAFELGARERAMAGASACLARVYTNENRGVSVSVLLLGGLPGDISLHTPDICYPGAGYNLETPSPYDYQYMGDERRHAGFQFAKATRGGTNPSNLQILWTWNDSTSWSAPDDPRWIFGTVPALCKLYVIRETKGAASVDPKNDPVNDFLAVFLPELDRHVFPTTK